MKKLLMLALLLFSVVAFPQTNDAALNTRIKDYLAYNKALNFEKVMDYIHPKLFAIAPREAILQSFEQTFKSEEMRFSFDSMVVTTATPIYKFGSANYRRINYFTRMSIAMNKDSMDLKDTQLAGAMKQAFTTGFPGKQIRIDTARNAIVVAGTSIMFAIKDASVTDWMFLGYEPKQPELNRQLYPVQVRTHFKLK